MKKHLLLLWVLLLILFSLAIATFIGTQHIDRLYTSSNQLLTNASFLNGNKYWKEWGDGQIDYSLGTVTVSNSKTESTTLSQRVALKDTGYHTLTFEGTTRGVSKGTGFADLATVVVIYRDKQGKFLSNQAALRLYGTNAKQPFTLNMYLPNKVHSVDISARLLRSTGVLKVSNLVFTKSEEFNSYKLFYWFITVTTTLVLFVFTTALTRMLKFRSTVFVVVLIGAIGLGTLSSGNLVFGTSELLAESLPKYFLQISHSLMSLLYGEGNFTSGGPAVSKMGHAATFFLLGLATMPVRFHCGTSFASALIIYIAFATEVLQRLSLLRSASVVDFYIDSTFGLAGLLLGAIFSIYWRLKSD